jgi:hypothetical protein
MTDGWGAGDQYQTVFSSKCQCWRRECVPQTDGKIDWLNRTNKPATPRRHFLTRVPVVSVIYYAISWIVFDDFQKTHVIFWARFVLILIFIFLEFRVIASSCARVMNYRRNVHKRSGWTLWPHERWKKTAKGKRKKKKRLLVCLSARKVSE